MGEACPGSGSKPLYAGRVYVFEVATWLRSLAPVSAAAAQILPAMGHSLHVLTSTRSEPLFGVPCTQLPGIRPKVRRGGGSV